MEKDDKGSTMIRMGVSGWKFALVPAYPGCHGSKAVKRSLCFSWCSFTYSASKWMSFWYVVYTPVFKVISAIVFLNKSVLRAVPRLSSWCYPHPQLRCLQLWISSWFDWYLLPVPGKWQMSVIGRDRWTDTRLLHRPFTAYYVGSVSEGVLTMLNVQWLCWCVSFHAVVTRPVSLPLL